jgi:single-strand DNA-binding protein
MINNAVIMGRLTKDPELKTTANGISVTSFTIAVDRKFNKQGEEKQADFIDIVVWRGTADFVCKYFRKGQMIAVQGSIQTRMYEDKSGKKCKVVEIVADDVSFCGDKNNGAASATPTITPSDDENYRDIPEDDLPF